MAMPSLSWGSYGQDNADGLQGVYGQILSPAGVKINSEFRVNQFTPHNQRTPAVAAFKNGNFIVGLGFRSATSHADRG